MAFYGQYYAQQRNNVRFGQKTTTDSHILFAKIDNSAPFRPMTSGFQNINLQYRNFFFNLLELMPRAFTITTKNGSAMFNTDILKDTSSIISQALSVDSENLQYHLDIEDTANVLGKFELLYQGKPVLFHNDELPVYEKIITELNINNIPKFLFHKPNGNQNDGSIKSPFASAINNNFPVVMCKKNFYNFVRLIESKSFTIITNRREYKCNPFGVLSSSVICEEIAKDPKKTEYVYNFDDEFDEFGSICDLFNFSNVKITSGNMNIIKEISEDLQIKDILNDLDKYINEYEKISETIDEQQNFIDTIDELFNMLININQMTVSTVAENILNSNWSKTDESVQELAAFILQVIKTNILLHDKLSDLLIQLDKEADETNSLKILKPFINDKLYKAFGESKQVCSFIYNLRKKGFIPNEKMNDLLKNFTPLPQTQLRAYGKPYSSSIGSNSIVNQNIFDWFLPEIVEMKNFDYNAERKRFSNQRDVFFRKYFPDKIDEYKKMLDSGEPDDEITKLIRHDNVDGFQNIVSNGSFNIEKASIPYNIYEEFDLKTQLSYLNYAAAYGSIKIFKYLLLNHCKVDSSTFEYAIYGGNIEIIKIVDQKISENDIKLTPNVPAPGPSRFGQSKVQNNKFKKIEYSIKKHQNDLFDWILEQKLNNDPALESFLKEIAISSANNGNAHALVAAIDKGFNLRANHDIILRAAENGFYNFAQMAFNIYIQRNGKDEDKENAKDDDEEKAKDEDEEKTKEEEEKAKEEEDEEKTKEEEEKAKDEDEEKAKDEDEEKTKDEDEEKAKDEDEEKAKDEDEEKTKDEDEEKTKEENEEKAKDEKDHERNEIINKLKVWLNDKNAKNFLSFGNLAIFKIVDRVVEPKVLGSCLTYCVDKQYMKIIRYFFDTLAKEGVFKISNEICHNSFNLAVQKDTNNIFKYLLEHFELINPIIYVGFNWTSKILSSASRFKNFEAIKIIVNLIKKNENQEKQVAIGKKGHTLSNFTECFSNAAIAGSLEICQFLIDNKLYIDFASLASSSKTLSSVNVEIFSLMYENSSSVVKAKYLENYVIPAITKKNNELVRYLLKEDAPCENALIEAVNTRSLEMVDIVLQHKNKPYFVNKNSINGTALSIATRNNDIEIVKLLLSVPGINASIYNKNLATPLQTSVYNYNTEIANLILDFYEDDGTNHSWEMHEIIKKLLDIVDKYINGRPTVNQLQARQSVWINAARPSVWQKPATPSTPINTNPPDQKKEELYKVFIRIISMKGVDINFVNSKNTFLTYACANNKIELVKSLLNTNKVDPNLFLPNTGDTALMIAINSRFVDIAKILIEYPKTDLNIKNFSDKTALTIAVDNNLDSVIDILIVNDKLDPEENNLNYAFYYSSPSICKHIIASKKIDVNTVFQYKQNKQNGYNRNYYLKEVGTNDTKLVQATSANDLELVDLIINHPSFDQDKSDLKRAIFTSISSNNIEMFRKLIKITNNDINTYERNGQNIFSYALEMKSNEILLDIFKNPSFELKGRDILTDFIQSFTQNISVNFQLKASIEIMKGLYNYDQNHDHLINLNSLLKNGKTFFTSIPMNLGNVAETVSFFLENGADPNIPDCDDIYPLEFGMMINSLDYVSPLIDSDKIDFTQKIPSKHEFGYVGPKYQSYLHLAAKSNNPRILQKILQKKAIDINIVDDLGETPLMTACLFKQQQNVYLLFKEENLDFHHKNKKGQDCVQALLNSNDPNYQPKENKDDYLAQLLELVSNPYISTTRRNEDMSNFNIDEAISGQLGNTINMAQKAFINGNNSKWGKSTWQASSEKAKGWGKTTSPWGKKINNNDNQEQQAEVDYKDKQQVHIKAPENHFVWDPIATWKTKNGFSDSKWNGNNGSVSGSGWGAKKTIWRSRKDDSTVNAAQEKQETEAKVDTDSQHEEAKEMTDESKQNESSSLPAASEEEANKVNGESQSQEQTQKESPPLASKAPNYYSASHSFSKQASLKWGTGSNNSSNTSSERSTTLNWGTRSNNLSNTSSERPTTLNWETRSSNSSTASSERPTTLNWGARSSNSSNASSERPTTLNWGTRSNNISNANSERSTPLKWGTGSSNWSNSNTSSLSYENKNDVNTQEKQVAEAQSDVDSQMSQNEEAKEVIDESKQNESSSLSAASGEEANKLNGELHSQEQTQKETPQPVSTTLKWGTANNNLSTTSANKPTTSKWGTANNNIESTVSTGKTFASKWGASNTNSSSNASAARKWGASNTNSSSNASAARKWGASNTNSSSNASTGKPATSRRGTGSSNASAVSAAHKWGTSNNDNESTAYANKPATSGLTTGSSNSSTLTNNAETSSTSNTNNAETSSMSNTNNAEVSNTNNAETSSMSSTNNAEVSSTNNAEVSSTNKLISFCLLNHNIPIISNQNENSSSPAAEQAESSQPSGTNNFFAQFSHSNPNYSMQNDASKSNENTSHSNGHEADTAESDANTQQEEQQQGENRERVDDQKEAENEVQQESPQKEASKKGTKRRRRRVRKHHNDDDDDDFNEVFLNYMQQALGQGKLEYPSQQLPQNQFSFQLQNVFDPSQYYYQQPGFVQDPMMQAQWIQMNYLQQPQIGLQMVPQPDLTNMQMNVLSNQQQPKRRKRKTHK